jgi:hypothetical protein
MTLRCLVIQTQVLKPAANNWFFQTVITIKTVREFKRAQTGPETLANLISKGGPLQ